MKLLALCAAGIGLMLCASCTNNKHLISDEAERAAVQQDFEARRDTRPKVTSSRYLNNP